nr:glycine oxidase ThiO [Nitrosomonas aestuarii]
MMKHDAVVIGAGIIGLATAEYLLKQGLKVTLLERGRVGQESSWAGGGILSPICPWNYIKEVTQLTQYSADLFPAWVNTLRTTTGIDPEYDQCGVFVLPPYDLKKAELWCLKYNVTMTQRAVSIPFSINPHADINNRKTIEKAIFLPDIAQIRNPRLLNALHKRVIQLGAKIIENCSVYDMALKHKTVLSINSSVGKFSAGYFIIAAGAWSTEILGNYALNLNIKPVSGQMLLFKFDSPPLRAVVVQDNLYIIPRRDGHLLIGSTLEDTGFNKQITISARDHLLKFAQNLIPQLGALPIIRQWSGLRPASPGNIPTIGQHPQLSNLYINSGHFRYGITMAPASAEILTKEIVGGTQPFDITPYQKGWNGN